MFNFSKSLQTSNNKTDVQYKVLCDWLRTTQQICKRLEKRQELILLDVAKLYDLLLKNDSPPEFIENEENDNRSGD